jgi:hypothetical protein
MNSNTPFSAQTDGTTPNAAASSTEAPDMQQRQSGTNMYANPFIPTDHRNAPFDPKVWTSTMFGSSSTAAEPGSTPPIPKWAVPSSVSPKIARRSERVSTSTRGPINQRRSSPARNLHSEDELLHKPEKWENAHPSQTRVACALPCFAFLVQYYLVRPFPTFIPLQQHLKGQETHRYTMDALFSLVALFCEVMLTFSSSLDLRSRSEVIRPQKV